MTASQDAARHPFSLCTDIRTVQSEPTGIGEYGRVLRLALQRAGADPLLLDEGAPSARGTWRRRLAAVRPGGRRLQRHAHTYTRPDIFGEAYIRFKLTGQPLTLTASGRAGVMHWTYPLPLRVAGWRNIYTVHDVIPLDPDAASPVDGERLRRLLACLARSADRLVAVSGAACRDLQNLGIGSSKLALLPQAVDVAGIDETSPLPFPARSFFVVVGTLETRKNLLRLLDAYRASGIETPLVIAGPEGLGAAAILDAISRTPGVTRLPFQRRGALLKLIRDARALLFPSLAEGFGLPIAEAMALGTPVLTSRGGATEEVAGGAALLVDPRDTVDIAAALVALDRDEALRRRLSAQGAQRAPSFALEPYGTRAVALYEEVWRG